MPLRLHLIAILPRCPHAPAPARRAGISLSFVPKRSFTTTGPGPLRRWEMLWSSSRSRVGAVVAARGSPFGVATGKAMASSSAGRDARSGTATDRRKLGFPERLLIYHPGAARITFLVALKVSTIFIFSFFTLIAVPSYIQAGESYSITASIFLCGFIPTVFVAYTTAPFVTAVHMQIPHFARTSTELLRRFAASPPATTRLEIGTLSFFGTPRKTTLTVADLRPAKERWGMVNFVRENTEAASRARKWWQLPVVRKFNVQEGLEGLVKEGWVWKELERGIQRRATQPGGEGVVWWWT